jgi:regulator of cell morphogenesis and NO signaling
MTYPKESVTEVLSREHSEIDAAIERFSADPASSEALESLIAAIATLRRHIYLEEEALFPMLSAGGLVPPILVMLREHAQIWESLDVLGRELSTIGGAGDAPEICHRLLIQLQHHNVKEERIVYPEADEALAAQSTHSLTEFLKFGSLPDGWVCIRARS